jgi:hypothetical protein
MTLLAYGIDWQPFGQCTLRCQSRTVKYGASGGHGEAVYSCHQALEDSSW